MLDVITIYTHFMSRWSCVSPVQLSMHFHASLRVSLLVSAAHSAFLSASSALPLSFSLFLVFSSPAPLWTWEVCSKHVEHQGQGCTSCASGSSSTDLSQTKLPPSSVSLLARFASEVLAVSYAIPITVRLGAGNRIKYREAERQKWQKKHGG